MEIRLLVSLSGPAGSWNSGAVITVEEDEGERFIAAGIAESVRKGAAVETATAQPTVERAVVSHKRKKG